MSLLNRFFGKRDKEAGPAEVPDQAPEASVAEAQPAEEAEPGRPANDGPAPLAPAGNDPVKPVKKGHNESQTFQVTPPAKPEPSPEQQEPSPARRRIKIKSSAPATAPSFDDDDGDVSLVPNQDLRRSQTIRVDPPVQPKQTPAEERPALRDEFRQSQTIRVKPRKDVDSEEASPSPPGAGTRALPTFGTASSSPKQRTTAEAESEPPASADDRESAAKPASDAVAAEEQERKPEPSQQRNPDTILASEAEIEDTPDTSEEQTDTVKVPVSAVLAALPRDMRGRAWQQEGMPDGSFAMQRSLLLEQLRTGKVTVAVDEVAEAMPPGWLARDARGTVAMDISQIVPRLPEDWLQASQQEDEDVRAASEMGDLFQPTSREAADETPEQPDEGSNDQLVELPADALLSSLPESLRGPAWSDGGLSGSRLLVPKDGLKAQLASGSITVDAEDLAEQLPDGWLASKASGSVELDLAAVVSALPADFFASDNAMAEDVKASEVIGELFRSAATKDESTVPGPEPETADQDDAAPSSSPSIPLSAVALSLPENARGLAWKEDALPSGQLDVSKDDILEQLASGRVTFEASVLQAALPPGWLRDELSETVELDLATIVQALPEDLMQVDADLDEDARAAAELGELFSPARQDAGVQQQTDSEAPALKLDDPQDDRDEETDAESAANQNGEQTEPPGHEPAELPPAHENASEPEDEVMADDEGDEGTDGDSAEREWDGVEPSLELAPLGINLNTARPEQLAMLPSIGEVRARQIVAYRDKHGKFKTIFELGEIPGVGPYSFKKMTGFSLRRRTSRHDVLMEMLDLEDDGRPMLSRIADALRKECAATGCLVTNQEGIPLSVSGAMPDAQAYAALGSRYFFRTRRHLQRFVDKASDCIILPGSEPPLLLIAHRDVVAILTLSGNQVSRGTLNRLRRAMREVGWLLSARAVVLAM